MKRTALFTVVSLVLLLLAAAVGGPPAADAQEPMIQVRIEGTVESFDGTTVVIDGFPFSLNAGMDTSALVVGQEVAVTGVLLADNSVLVVQAEALTDDGDSDDGDDNGPAADGLVICHFPPGNPENAHSLIIDPAAAETHIANHGDTMGPCEGDQTACDTFTPSPVADSLALEFGETADAVDAWVCQGFDYTQIVYALLLANAFDDDADAILQRVNLGESWDTIWTEYGITPAELINEQGVIGAVEQVADDDDGDDGDDADDGDFVGVAICHRPPGNPDNAHTLYVGEAAVNAHLAHGDTQGICEGDATLTPTGTVTTTVTTTATATGTATPTATVTFGPTLTWTPGPAATATGVDTGAQVTICHRPPGNPENAQTITIGQAAVDAHMAHGDSMGPCP